MRSTDNYVQQPTVAEKQNYQLHLSLLTERICQPLSALHCRLISRQTSGWSFAFLTSPLSRMLNSQSLAGLAQ